MIKNSKEYDKIKSRLDDWRKTLNEMQSVLKEEDYVVYLQAHAPMIRELESEMVAYESLRSGVEQPAYYLNPLEIGKRLVQTRIRSGWTQEKLASKIKVTQAQISRSEDDEYSNAPLMRLYEIGTVLGLKLITLLVPIETEQFFIQRIKNILIEFFSSGSQAVITSLAYPPTPFPQATEFRSSYRFTLQGTAVNSVVSDNPNFPKEF